MRALDVRDSLDAPPTRGVNEVHSLDYMLETAERIEQGEEIPTRMTDFFGSGPGAGGARPKAAVRDETGLLWLAKQHNNWTWRALLRRRPPRLADGMKGSTSAHSPSLRSLG